MRVGLFLCAAVGAVAVAMPASAQTAADSQNGADRGGIADIVVTAQKRSQTIQDTPLSITALSGDMLAKSGVTDLNNAVGLVPSVQVQSSNTGATYFIRGIGQVGNTGSSPVSVHIDGIYQQQPEITGAAGVDVNRIEVLRGPQGTLYGRNANGGTINVITNDPALGVTSADVKLGIGNYSTRQVEAAVNLPVGSTLALRVAGALNAHDGYLTNGLSDRNDRTLRGKLLWQPVEELSVLLSAENVWIDSKGAGNVLISEDYDNPWTSAPYHEFSVVFTGDPVFCSPGCRPYYKVHNQQYRAEVNYEMPWATFTALGGIQRYRRHYLQAFGDGLEGDTTPVDQSSVELRLASPAASPVQWVLGAYYLDRDADGNVKYVYQINVATRIAISRERSKAVFGQLTYPLTDSFRLTGGLRYTHDETRQRVDDGEVDGTTDTLVGYTLGALQRGTFNKVTYKAGAEYDIAPRSMLYGSVSTGFRAGGVDSLGGSYEPETITAYEVGSKNRFLDNSMILNASLYYYRYEGYQLSYAREIDGSSVPVIVTSNVPGVTKVWGAEVEGMFDVTSLDRLNYTASYQRSKFADATLATSCSPSGECTYTALGGRTLPRMPKWTLTGGWEHRFPLGNGAEIQSYVDAQYKSGYDTNLVVFDGSRQNGVTLVNARLTYQAADERFSISAYVRNLTDKAVLIQSNTAGPVNRYGILGDPRTYGVSLQAKF